MFNESLKGIPAELIKFASVGLLNTFLGLVIIYSLKWRLYWGDVSANLAGYLVCILLGFVLNSRWTFGLSNLKPTHLIGYLLVVVFAYLMNLCAVLLSINWLNVPGDYAQLLGMPVFTLISFMLNKFFVFSNSLRVARSLKHE